jgi:recombinational DNA repair protein (RecF pathway)
VPEGPFAVAVHEDNSEVLAHRVDEGSVGQHGSGASPANESQHGFRISGQTLLDLAQGVFHNPLTLKEARDLMRLLIHYQLDGRELLSRTLFNSYRTLSRSSREH